MIFSWNIFPHLFATIWRHSHLRTMAYICIISTAMSAATLTIIAAIMQGFEYHTYHHLQSLHPDITVRFPHNNNEYLDKMKQWIHEHPEYVTSFSPYACEYGMIYHHATESFHAISCCAIDPEAEMYTTGLINVIRTPHHTDLTSLVASPGIVIGSPLARYLHVSCGETVYIGYQSGCTPDGSPCFDYTSVVISGIYETGVEEQDAYITYMSHETYEDIWDELDISHIGIATSQQYIPSFVAHKISTDFPHASVRTWESAYPALLSALKLEKYAMIAIFSLLVMLASISSVALLHMVIHAKSRECAILHIMGLHPSSIQRYFIIASLLITIGASTCGIVIGVAISWFIDTYHIIPLPDAYYVTYLPAQISCMIIALIWIITCCINIIAAWLPSRIIHNMPLARTLKEHA